jgi:hypothetical protein
MPPLRFVELLGQPAGNVGLPLQFKHGRAQGSFVKSAGPCASERIIVAAATPHRVAFILSYSCVTQRATFPADCFVAAKQRRIIPTSRTGDTVVTRLDAGAANDTWLRIDERERGVKGSAGDY